MKNIEVFKSNIHHFLLKEAGPKAEKVYLVDQQFHSSLIKWIEGKIHRPQTPDISRLIGKENINLHRDYEVVDETGWKIINQNFGKQLEISGKFVQNPKTKEPCVIMKSELLQFILPNGETKKKYCDKNWNINDVKNFLCEHNDLDSKTHILTSLDGKAINSDLHISDISTRYNKKMMIVSKVPAEPKSSRNTQTAVTIINNKAFAASMRPRGIAASTFKEEEIKFPKSTISSPSKEKETLVNDMQLPSLYNLSPQRTKRLLSPHTNKLTDFPRPVGLTNLGNTCFFNSAVQCIIRVKPLTDFILSSNFESQINTKNKKGSNGKIALAYRYFLRQMCSATSYQNPSNLRSAIISKFRRFANYSQHDSQELLGSLLDGLHEDMNQSFYAGGCEAEIKTDENSDGWQIHISRNYSPIVQIFHGELFSNTECPKCGYISAVHEPFMFLSVPIPTRSWGKVNLKDCLASFEQVDKLDARNKWKCEQCKESVCATKRTGIYRCAEILIIHLKRFSGSGYFASKVDTEVDYPDTLDMSRFVDVSHGATYKLIGAVFHHGSLGGGHYTSAAVDAPSGQWYNFNDSIASSISASSAHSQSAYILFYQRI